MSELRFEVHLLEADAPIETGYVDFYDSGVWVDRPQRRTFYPYEHVEKGEERAETSESIDVR